MGYCAFCAMIATMFITLFSYDSCEMLCNTQNCRHFRLEGALSDLRAELGNNL